MLLLIKNARQHQTPLQYLDLLFQVLFRLQAAIEPVFHLNILLEQGITLLRGGDQPLADLTVDVQLFAHQLVALDIAGILRILRLFRRFFRQRQPFAVYHIL
ncbi:hypothetical protein D3C80_1622640 [compost metagenome]